MIARETPREVRDWLDRVNARALWEQRVKGIGLLAAYAVNGRVAIVQTYDRTGGFEVFVPASQSGRIDATLAAAEVALGLRDQAVAGV